MIGPANMKADLVAQVNALTAKALADPLVKARYNDLGATRWPTSPAEIKAFRCRGVKAVADHEGGRHQAGMNGWCCRGDRIPPRVLA
jgi:predicted metal-dependent phosphoesterase TrpH